MPPKIKGFLEIDFKSNDFIEDILGKNFDVLGKNFDVGDAMLKIIITCNKELTRVIGSG